MDKIEFEKFWKDLSFHRFEKDADLINHPPTEDKIRQAEDARKRTVRWTQEWFDYDDDPDDNGTTDPIEFGRLENELAALRLKLEKEEISEDDYSVAKIPILEAMYVLLKDE